jgi:hypothetical protein
MLATAPLLARDKNELWRSGRLATVQHRGDNSNLWVPMSEPTAQASVSRFEMKLLETYLLKSDTNKELVR